MTDFHPLDSYALEGFREIPLWMIETLDLNQSQNLKAPKPASPFAGVSLSEYPDIANC
jgi:hypothetical protein